MRYAFAFISYLLVSLYFLGVLAGWVWGILGMLVVLGWMWFPYGLLSEQRRRRWKPFLVMSTAGMVALTLLFLFLLHPPQLPECPPCEIVYCPG